MRIKKLFYGHVSDLEELVVEDDYDEIKVIGFPFKAGVRGDYVLVLGIKR